MKKKSIFTMNVAEERITLQDALEKFLFDKELHNKAAATIRAYRTAMATVSSSIDFSKNTDEITTDDLNELLQDCKDRDCSDQTISHYFRHFKAFRNWCVANGYTMIEVPSYHAAEVVKETYSDADLIKLLKKPDTNKCDFAEYRNWVIINFLCETGCRAGSLIEIRIKDMDFDARLCQFRHNKTGKIQSVPLSEALISVLLPYLKVRKGTPESVLFPDIDGQDLTYNALKLAINKYNKQRGVAITSIHAFRHTFAKNYLLSDGDPFRLQKILNHSTLDMTKHYCAIYNKDMLQGFESHSTLARLQPKRMSMKG